MYDLPYFKEKNPEVIRQFMKEHPFVFLTACGNDLQPVATQVPVFIDERDGQVFLSGHMMKNTDHHKALLQNPKVLAVFNAPGHTYVSASWYSDKGQGSTWNYMSVHAQGTLRFLDHQALLNVLQRTTDHFEDDPNSGSNFNDLPQEYVERMSKAIVAFEIMVTRIENVFKLSQNRDEESYRNIIGKLETRGAGAQFIAAEMKKRINDPR